VQATGLILQCKKHCKTEKAYIDFNIISY